MGGRKDTILSFNEIAKFHAVVFVPSQRQQMMFNDLYAMAMPLFLPDARLFARTFLAEFDTGAHPRWAGLDDVSLDSEASLASSWHLSGAPGAGNSGALANTV